jgi:hypothetical protein
VDLHLTSPVSEPMETVFVDFMGPLTRSKRGNIAVLVVADAFSKFVSFFPLRKIASQVVCDCLENGIFPVYGTPASIVTDKAKAFRCKHVRDLYFRWGFNHITTTPYYPQGSLAERVNSNLKSALKTFNHESQDRWDLRVDLPWPSLAFNMAIHKSTKYTLDKLFLRKEIKPPLLVRWDLTAIATDGIWNDNQSFWARAYSNLKRSRNRVAKR